MSRRLWCDFPSNRTLLEWVSVVTEPIGHYIVLANPSYRSFCHEVARAYKEVVQANHQTATIFDLNAALFDPVLQDRERFDHGSHRWPWVEAELQRLSSCGALILVYPIWFGGPPAILKGYVDRVLGAQCALTDFQSGTGQPAVRGRYLLSISTSGATAEWLSERGQQHALREGFDTYIERGFGLRDGGHINLDGIVHNMSSDHAAKALARVREAAESMCSRLAAAS